MVPCSQTIHFVLAHCLKRFFLSPTTLLHAMIALKNTFFQILKLFLFTPLPSLIMKAKRIWACLGQRLKSTLT